jgi:hypothetical protein
MKKAKKNRRGSALTERTNDKDPGMEAARACYEPNELERSALAAVLQKRQSRPPLVRTKVEAGRGVTHLSFDHADQGIGFALLANAFGTGSSDFAQGLLAQLADVSRTGKLLSSKELDFVLTVIRGIAPKDETEALLAAQMAAVHNATMTTARRLNHVETIPQQDSASNALNKLARTFAAQVEALKKYRSTGEQSIRVQHVTVNDGGQTIVGDVQAGGGGHGKNGEQPHEPSRSAAESAPLLGHVETLAAALPSPGSEGVDRVPVPRRTRRRAGGQG